MKGCIEGNNKPLRILIDNASQAELISEKVAKELSKEITSSNIKLATAQGASLEIKGQVKLDLSIGGHKSEVITQVVSQLSPVYDAILGIGWLNQHDTSLKTKKGHTPIFCIDDTEIPIIQNRKEKGLTVLNVENITPEIIDFAKAASTTFIKPRSKGFMKVAIPYNNKLLGDSLVYFEPMPKSTEYYDVYGDNESDSDLFELHRGIVKIKSTGNNKLYCHIAYSNLGTTTKTFNKGQKLGFLSLADSG